MKPDAVVRAERVLGVIAESWRPVTGRGYANNERWLVALEGGRSVFVKTAVDDAGADWLRDEHRIYRGVQAAFLPELLGWDDDGAFPVLVLEDVSGGAFWLPSLELEGGPKPDAVLPSGPGVAELAALVAGFFAARAGLPPPSGAPTVRGIQLAQLRPALAWACRALGLPQP